MNRGYIPLFRCVIDSAIWELEKVDKFKAWVDLWLNANWKEKTVSIRGNHIKINRGQLAWSELTMAQRWNWSRNKVRAYLDYLEEIGKIKLHKSNRTTVITICNYDIYQGEL